MHQRLSFQGPSRNLEALKAQLRLGKRDRPSRLHPRTARSGEGDARVKAGGAVPLAEPELSLARRQVLRKSQF